jgi:hypothetical protein
MQLMVEFDKPWSVLMWRNRVAEIWAAVVNGIVNSITAKNVRKDFKQRQIN